MNRFFSRLAFFTVLLLLLGCEAITRLDGRITDELGQPIESATIALDVSSPVLHGETQSKSDGTYHIGLNHAPGASRSVTVPKPGYQTFRKKLHSRPAEVRLDVVLKPESSR